MAICEDKDKMGIMNHLAWVHSSKVCLGIIYFGFSQYYVSVCIKYQSIAR